jgi:acyl-coenzyme A synthetase/AMP-(fatty) acid ligase/aryl carrier-like protein
MLTGESLPRSLLTSLLSKIPNGAIYNAYGPTEATLSATTWMDTAEFTAEIVPIGKPNSNKKVYILDPNMRPSPIGVIGELYIGGTGIARGYLHKPDLTSAVFMDDPFSNDPNARMYKTGDLVRYLPDGNIVYHGRIDHQIKIRGYRVELGEIESRISEHSLIKESVVLALGDGANKRLVAYVVADPTDNLPRTLHSYLSSKLPDYMVPSAFVRLDSLPLTTNGKLDRRALPDPDTSSFVTQEYEMPRNEMEVILAGIWSDLLKIERIGRNDNFFMLGGHSLLAIQLIERLRRIEIHLSIRNLFATPTLSVLAQSLTKNNINTEAPINLITYNTQ